VPRPVLPSTLLALAAAVAGGSAGELAPPPTAAQAATSAAAAPSANGPGALQAEANAAATGDIPDNQVFLVFDNRRAGYSIKYPEGWAQQGSGTKVVFRDKNNIIRIDVAAGGATTKTAVARELRQLKGVRIVQPPQATTISGRPAVKVVYTTVSAPNPVTGKRVTLIVDRYYLAHAGRRAVVDLGTPQGVDNVDAYRLMIDSFRWK
jgi:hypothetical protein